MTCHSTHCIYLGSHQEAIGRNEQSGMIYKDDEYKEYKQHDGMHLLLAFHGYTWTDWQSKGRLAREMHHQNS